MLPLKDLLQKRANVWDSMQKLNDLTITENRDFTSDEETKYQNMETELESHDKQIERSRKLEGSRAKDGDSLLDFRSDGEGEHRGGGGQGDQGVQLRALENFERNRNKFEGLPESEAKAVRSIQEAGFRSYVKNGTMNAIQQRAIQQGVDDEGGYLVAPVQWMDQLIQAVDNEVIIRQYATVYSMPNAQSLGVPSLDTDLNDADWTTELATGNEDTALRLGKRELATNPFAKLVKISKKLLRSTGKAESLVMERMAYKFGVTEETGFMTGDGQSKPLGLFTASTDGISTGRDVSTNNTTTAITFNGLIEALSSVKGQYHKNSRWVFHRDAIKMLRKIVDSNGQYIWQQSVVVGEPDRILNFPYITSEYCPNTFTTGLYVGLFGDLSKYWILDSMSMEVQRLTELYAPQNQMGFIGRAESDGMPVLEEAFARVTLA